MLNAFKRIREDVNTFLYDSQKGVIITLRTTIQITSLIAIGLLIYYHGFPIEASTKEILFEIIKGVFGIFIINYCVRLFYSFEKIEFIKNTWFEGILILLLIIDIMSLYIFSFPLLEITFNKLGITNFYPIYIIFVQLYILILILAESREFTNTILSKKINPATLFIATFLIIILAGCVLLLLPEMTPTDKSLSIQDALFTSVSATCVTGLIVVDTATYFTFKGHIVIFCLMQIGGIGIVAFATFFASFLKKGVGIRHQGLIHDYVHESSLYNSLDLLRKIIFYTFLFELIGATAIYTLLDPAIPFDNNGEKVFFAFFHSISAFCNAGFSLFTDGMRNSYLREAFILQMTIAALVIFGGLGFPVLRDLFGIKNLRMRLQQRWKNYKTSTQVALKVSASLIVGSTIIFLLLEWDNSLKDLNAVEAVMTAIFQSVTTRTAGFSTVDISSLNISTYILIIYLMFIGASSGSTGGGVKTSTFFVIVLSVIATIRGRQRMEFSRKTVSNNLLYRAFSIFIFASLFIIVCSFLLTLTEPDKSMLQLGFEAVSAFCNVGFTIGVTASLSSLGKIIIILAMFVGRVGILSLAFSLSSPAAKESYKYPSTNIMIG